MSDFRITGTEDFHRLSKALKQAGRGELRKELNKRLQAAVKPVIAKSRAETSRLPKSGGLAAQVAKEPQKVQVRTGSRTVGVRLVVGRSRGGARNANRGVIRHPVFGDRDNWVSQKVPAGWFDEPAEAALPEVEQGVRDAMQSVVDDIVRGVR